MKKKIITIQSNAEDVENTKPLMVIGVIVKAMNPFMVVG
jgi:hypothetical protein